jgi:SPX domain protein involved in polyphosphate accumulation
MSSPFSRFEFKYLIPEALMRAVESDLLRFGMKKDAAGNPYTVTSLYFDSPDFCDYNDKLGGFLRRKKVRARIYGESLHSMTDPTIWLELKDKYDMKIFKRRIALPKKYWENFPAILREPNFLQGAYKAQEKNIFDEFRFEIAHASRMPSVLVSYLRKAFIQTIAGQRIRITLDSALKAARPSPDFETRYSRRIMPGWGVLEIKYDKFLPAYANILIQKYNLRREAYSKYARGIETIRRYNPLPK